jgi:hypothetical protein
MFRIESSGIFGRKSRLIAPSMLSPADFRRVADRLGRRPITARKIGYVAARRAERTEKIDTCWEGRESQNTAQPGDWMVTNLSPQRSVLRDSNGHHNTYVIKAENFPRLYELTRGHNEFGQIFKAKGTIEAVFLSGGFDVLAPWGQKQTAAAGYLVLNGEEVYGNNAQTFKATYEILH